MKFGKDQEVGSDIAKKLHLFSKIVFKNIHILQKN